MTLSPLACSMPQLSPSPDPVEMPEHLWGDGNLMISLPTRASGMSLSLQTAFAPTGEVDEDIFYTTFVWAMVNTQDTKQWRTSGTFFFFFCRPAFFENRSAFAMLTRGMSVLLEVSISDREKDPCSALDTSESEGSSTGIISLASSGVVRFAEDSGRYEGTCSFAEGNRLSCLMPFGCRLQTLRGFAFVSYCHTKI